MKTLMTVLILALAVVGCASGGHHSSSPWTVSPQGYRVAFEEQGSITAGLLTVAQAYEIHAKAVDRAALELKARHNIDPAITKAKAASAAFRLIDNHSFEFGGIYACGQWLPAQNTVRTCLYDQRTVASIDMVPKDAPKWMTRPGWKYPGTFVYGLRVPGNEFPSLSHELGHAITGDPNFEH